MEGPMLEPTCLPQTWPRVDNGQVFPAPQPGSGQVAGSQSAPRIQSLLGVRNGFLCSESVLAVTEEASPDDQDEYPLCLGQEIRTFRWAGTEVPTSTQSPES